MPNIKSKNALKRWIKDCVSNENRIIGEINIIMCSDEYLLQLNRDHLKHDYYTDIITFDYTIENTISGDLYISTERVFENANKFRTDQKKELYRVIIHGVMHLIGYKDKTKKDTLIMRRQEQKSLDKLVDFGLI